MNTREEDLAAALLWLRNHYDVGSTQALGLQAEVIERIDRVLEDGAPVTIATSTAFKEKYARKSPKGLDGDKLLV